MTTVCPSLLTSVVWALDPPAVLEVPELLPPVGWLPVLPVVTPLPLVLVLSVEPPPVVCGGFTLPLEDDDVVGGLELLPPLLVGTFDGSVGGLEVGSVGGADDVCAGGSDV